MRDGEENLTSISKMSISRCVAVPDERWRHLHAQKWITHGDSSAVLSAAIRYAVIAEELSSFNHVIERVVTQSGEGETAVHFPPLINRTG